MLSFSCVRTTFVLNNQTLIEMKQQGVVSGRSGEKVLSHAFLLNFASELKHFRKTNGRSITVCFGFCNPLIKGMRLIW